MTAGQWIGNSSPGRGRPRWKGRLSVFHEGDVLLLVGPDAKLAEFTR
jgi:hypothetical protein